MKTLSYVKIYPGLTILSFQPAISGSGFCQPCRVLVAAIILVVGLFIATEPAISQTGRDVLCAGVVRIDITPEKPVKMSGYGRPEGLSQGVHDPLSARVVAWENKGKRLVLVSTDILGFYSGTADYLRKHILDEFELKPSELFLSAVHTHSGPELTIDKTKSHANNLEYTKGLKDKLIKAIREAFRTMEPVHIGVGAGCSPVGINRREMRIDGTGWPKASKFIKGGRNPYGPVDKGVLVMKVAKPDGTTLAVLFDYACHSTALGNKNYIISGDLLGLAEQFVERILGPNVTAPAFAGASGDINPWVCTLPEFNTEPGWIPEPVLLATMLGEEVVTIFRDIKTDIPDGEISTAFITMELPKKKSEVVGYKIPQSKGNTVSLNVIAGRVGDVAFIGFGCEVCTEIGMAIKAASPYKHTFVITHCNGAASYLPTKDMHKEGGYEVISSPFAPQAADMVVKQSLKMLYAL